MTDGGISPYGSPRTVRRIRTHHLQAMKERGERWAMLTAYDMHSAAIFDEVGIPALLVGDSAANNVFGFDTTLPVTVDELMPLVRAVVRSTRSAMVIADLPFGSYQVSAEQALQTAIRFMKEGGAQAVKLEGGRQVVAAGTSDRRCRRTRRRARRLHAAERARARRIQACRDAASQPRTSSTTRSRSKRLEHLPSCSRWFPPMSRRRSPRSCRFPTIGIGAGPDCDAQVMVWTDMVGLNTGPAPRFVKRYADLRAVITEAASTYAARGCRRDLPRSRALLRVTAASAALVRR